MIDNNFDHIKLRGIPTSSNRSKNSILITPTPKLSDETCIGIAGVPEIFRELKLAEELKKSSRSCLYSFSEESEPENLNFDTAKI